MSKKQEEKWLLEEKYGGEKCEAFFADVKRLAAGEPLGYIIGHVPFLGCRIYLDSRPLIPRPETEFWAEKAIEEIKKAGAATPRPLRILDLCAGSGNIGIAAAKAVPSALIDFAEIDANHHATIRKNLAANGISPNRIRIFGGNLFENIPMTHPKLTEMDELQGAGATVKEPYALYGEEPSGTRNEEDRHFRKFRYDFILTNPPYIDPALDRAEPSVKAHEPHLALYGGSSGTEIINTILQDSAKYLKTNSQLWLEHEPEQAEAVREGAEATGFRATTHPDQYGLSRFSILMR